MGDNGTSWILRVEPNQILPHGCTIELGSYTILTGFNATAKSILARTVYALLRGDADEANRLWGGLNVKVSLSTPFGSINYDGSEIYSERELRGEVFAELIPDSRLFLREALVNVGVYRFYEDIGIRANKLCREISSIAQHSEFGRFEMRLSEECEQVVEGLRDNNEKLRHTIFSIIERIKEVKQSSREKDLTQILGVYDEVLKKAAKSINEVLEEAGEEPIDVSDLNPFEITVLPGEEPRLEVVDKRFNSGKVVEPNKLSSSVAAYLSILLVMHVLSQPTKAVVLVIEEPEEGLAPPQQYMFSYFLGKVSKELNKDIRIIVTTHSPYVVYAGLTTGATIYYTRFSRREKGFIVSKRSLAIFALADRVALALRRVWEEGSRSAG
jgi:hypothetical protein